MHDPTKHLPTLKALSFAFARTKQQWLNDSYKGVEQSNSDARIIACLRKLGKAYNYNPATHTLMTNDDYGYHR